MNCTVKVLLSNKALPDILSSSSYFRRRIFRTSGTFCELELYPPNFKPIFQVDSPNFNFCELRVSTPISRQVFYIYGKFSELRPSHGQVFKLQEDSPNLRQVLENVMGIRTTYKISVLQESSLNLWISSPEFYGKLFELKASSVHFRQAIQLRGKFSELLESSLNLRQVLRIQETWFSELETSSLHSMQFLHMLQVNCANFGQALRS